MRGLQRRIHGRRQERLSAGPLSGLLASTDLQPEQTTQRTRCLTIALWWLVVLAFVAVVTYAGVVLWLFILTRGMQ